VVTKETIHKQGGVAVASVGGMSTDGADFAKTRNCETLASHGDEFIVDAYAVVSPHFMGARAEESRKSEVCESHHRGRVLGGHAKY